MKPVYTAENLFDAQLVRDRLVEAGVAAKVHGTLLTGAVGELPADTRPTVWIEDDELYERARQLVTAFEQADPEGQNWTCPACGEANGPAFETCWHCGSAPPAGAKTTTNQSE